MSMPASRPMVVGRFAPSPTGSLHVGSLVAAAGSYCLARQAGGLWLVRMEDLDIPRVVPGAAEGILRTLEEMGMHWDGDVVYQSRRAAAYEAAVDRLQERGLIFPCACSRREILASAPHPGEEGPVYSGTCRHGLPPGRDPRSLRIRVPSSGVCFTDGILGEQEQVLANAVGDFVLRRADGLFAYQLAVVVDDAEAGVNQVVRGADLVGSTPRQIYLHSCLGLPVPAYIHLPLAVSATGEKISKRDGIGEIAIPGRSILWQVLSFLGQEPPKKLAAAPNREVLDWGVNNFSLPRVPKQIQQPWGSAG